MEWIGFRMETVTRRTQHRLGKVMDRIHILEGRQLVLLNIDEVIAIIRESDEPKAALIARFNLSERQADDILDIRLRQLARLEAIKIEQELAELRTEQAKLQDILDNPGVLKRTVVKEIEQDAKQFGDERRTLIQAEKRAVAEVKVIDEPVTVVISEKGWVRARTGHGHDPAGFAFKAGDALYGTFECRTVDPLIVIGNNGRVYSVAVSALPGARGDGQPITTMIELESGTQPLHYLAAAADRTLLLANTGGFGLLAKMGDLITRQKGGKGFLTLDEGDTLLPPILIKPGHTQVACLAEAGRMLVFGLDELKLQSNGGRGLTLMDVDPKKDPLISVATVSQGVRVIGTTRGGKPKEEDVRNSAYLAHIGKRARKGKAVDAFQKVMRVQALD
jgi:topoisomerase-4 subunit A